MAFGRGVKRGDTQPTDIIRKEARKIKTQSSLFHLLVDPPINLTRRKGQERLSEVIIWVSLGEAEGEPKRR